MIKDVAASIEPTNSHNDGWSPHTSIPDARKETLDVDDYISAFGLVAPDKVHAGLAVS
jgi:hypothetical protein